ncbi:MAG TPA: hypothetical protein VK968_08755, partial [Roseimicrobium sp.]|nr:hypothetical protein [Roseimicrobium sp.]
PKPEPETAGIEPIRTLEEELREIERLAKSTSDSYAFSIAEQARHLTKIAETKSFASSDLEHVIACVFDTPLLPSWQVSKELRDLETRLVEARVQVVARLKAAGVEPIYPIVNQDRFDADLHLDAGGSPGGTDDPAKDQLIVEVLKPGITLNGEVVFQAKVFRLQSAAIPVKELSIEDLPERKSTGDVGW